MSLMQDLTYTAVIGSKENIIRMLNAAIRNVGTGNEIVEGDSLETIKSKIKEEDGQYNLRIALPDLLDAAVMQEDWAKEKKNEFASRHSHGEDISEPDCDDEEYYDDSTNERMIDIEGVYEEGDNYRAEFQLYECENCAYYHDWLNWGDIARIYNCTILVDNDLYRNGRYESFLGTTIYQPENGKVKETQIKPELDTDSFVLTYDKLIKLYPERYQPRKIKDIKEKIRLLKGELNGELIETAPDQLKANDCQCHENLKEMYPDLFKDIQTQRVEIEYELTEPEVEDETDNNNLIDENGHAVIPDGTQEIEDRAFRNCKGLVSIEIPESVLSIGMEAFTNCSGLTSVILPSNLVEISLGAFINCTGLTSIVIPDSVKEIDDCAFKGCTSLTEVTIPEGVNMGFDVFYDCPCQEKLKNK